MRRNVSPVALTTVVSSVPTNVKTFGNPVPNVGGYGAGRGAVAEPRVTVLNVAGAARR
jgi:hypothetical protein